jgi:hypothetical protein
MGSKGSATVVTASLDAETEMGESDEGDGVTDSARHDPGNVQRHRTKRIKMRIPPVIFMVSSALVSASR